MYGTVHSDPPASPLIRASKAKIILNLKITKLAVNSESALYVTCGDNSYCPSVPLQAEHSEVILATPPVLKPAVFRAPKAGAVWGESLNSLNKTYL